MILHGRTAQLTDPFKAPAYRPTRGHGNSMARPPAEQAFRLVRPRFLGYRAVTGEAYRLVMDGKD